MRAHLSEISSRIFAAESGINSLSKKRQNKVQTYIFFKKVCKQEKEILFLQHNKENLKNDTDVQAPIQLRRTLRTSIPAAARP